MREVALWARPIGGGERIKGGGSGLAEFGLVMQLCHCSPPSLFAPPRYSSSNPDISSG